MSQLITSVSHTLTTIPTPAHMRADVPHAQQRWRIRHGRAQAARYNAGNRALMAVAVMSNLLFLLGLLLALNTGAAQAGAGAQCERTNGPDNIAFTDDDTFECGDGSDASGANASAVGQQALATGARSVAAGRFAQASEADAVALGSNASATGSGAVAVGTQSEAGTRALALGGTVVSPETTFSISLNMANYRGQRGYSGSVSARLYNRVYASVSIAGSSNDDATSGRFGVAIGF